MDTDDRLCRAAPAPAETMPFHTLKVELVHRCRWVRRTEARQAPFGYLEGYYNRHRMHSAMGDLSPIAAKTGDDQAAPGSLPEGIRLPAMRRWALDETGTNSVIPCNIPKNRASNQIILYRDLHMSEMGGRSAPRRSPSRPPRWAGVAGRQCLPAPPRHASGGDADGPSRSCWPRSAP